MFGSGTSEKVMVVEGATNPVKFMIGEASAEAVVKAIPQAKAISGRCFLIGWEPLI
jgi:hypothetical protein